MLQKFIHKSTTCKLLMDTFFISHGSPTLSIDDSLPARHFLKSWEDKVFQEKPKSILVISGHWETSEPTVNVIDGPNDTIYDFYGFPKPMYQLKYPAPGAPELAMRAKELLLASGFNCVKEDKARGLDHGAWVPIMLMYPKANIPVCQLSVQTDMDGAYHYNMGKALAPLREEGVLIIGSGSATHNLRALDRSDGSVVSWAEEFDTWLKESLINGRENFTNHLIIRLSSCKLLMDTFFISHGSPTLSIDDSLPARHFLKSWENKVFHEKLKSILVISAHWETSEPTVNVINGPNDTIYDFYGFPKPMYQVCSTVTPVSLVSSSIHQLFIF
ncbi:hypothetical protein IFM89_009891 [Coptis chinensis]|uniref:Extradiol ring-cleavage dioxygenase class III enzyme subunit B domain-containing protein n=1 Tax=Coptis chinensis TaxID=261450 RepID=A0A835HX15_9MAGN|nr:hypothetical protein IFM89_009891 [Coptis chinensis]